MGKVLDLNKKLSFAWEMAEEFARCSESIVLLSFVCPITGLQLSIGKLKIVDIASFLNRSRRGLKESADQLLTVRFYSRLSSVKSRSAQNARMLGGFKVFAFHFYKPFSFTFWILGEPESANFRF